MYSILLNDSNELIATKRERIMQRSKLVDSFRILFEKEYKDLDMTDFDGNIEFVLPVSKKYVSEILTIKECEEEGKENYLEAVLPFDTLMTAEAGDIEIQVTFVKVELDENGKGTQYVRKSSTCEITIVPISAWSDIIPDSALNAVDQKLLDVQAKIKELEDMAEILDKETADNLGFNDDGDLQLKSKGKFIGDSVSVAIPGTEDDEDDSHDGVIDADEIYKTVTI